MSELQDNDTPKNIEALVPLLALANRLGFVYGSDDISMFFYTLIRRERPRNIVELVFADITRGPDEILDVFFHFLPHMAESGSIFIDSASTSLSG